jgi:hypothetical protein
MGKSTISMEGLSHIYYFETTKQWWFRGTLWLRKPPYPHGLPSLGHDIPQLRSRLAMSRWAGGEEVAVA